jgi:phosphoglycerate dehydrogenase-like enzyme
MKTESAIPTARPKGIFLLETSSFSKIYPAPIYTEICQLADVYAKPQTAATLRQNPGVLAEAEVIFSGWGCPPFDDELLSAAPNLKMIFYGAGSVRGFTTPQLWARGIRVTSAWAANAVPVSEYCLAHILLALKCTLQHAALIRQNHTFTRLPVPGGYRSTVGLVSLGMIGRLVAERLRTFDVDVVAYDPFVSSYPGVTLLPLDELFRQSNVVSVHAPWLKETEGLITGAHLASMKPYSTLINSSRGAVINEPEMISVLQKRLDLEAILDVTYPEPPEPASALYTLPNVLLTGHIAGAMERECERMGALVLRELKHYLAGEDCEYEITQARAATMA